MIENEALNADNAYSIATLFEDSSEGIFSEFASASSIDTYRRNLQRAYVDVMGNLMKNENNNYDQTDIKAVTRATLHQLRNRVKSGAASLTDKISKYHADDLAERITLILEPNK
jgi:hypothetical protein